jgi:DNA-directed RNA polymerase specialized sigma24 family protein
VSTTAPRFPTTDWSMLAHAADDQAACQRLSLDQLLSRYLPPMRQYLLARRRVSAQHVDDLLQTFITERVMRDGLLKRADRSRGKFRNLLVRALTNFQIDLHRREQAYRGGASILQLSDDPGVAVDPGGDPARIFDRLWGEHVMAEALERTRVRLVTTNRAAVWEVFNRRMLDHSSGSDYQELALEFGFANPTQASSALLTAKRIFSRQLRTILGEYGGQNANVEEELHDLKKIFERGHARR